MIGANRTECLAFGTWLRKQRQDRAKRTSSPENWTQRALARRCGLTPAWVSRLERDKSRPSRAAAVTLARALGADEGEAQLLAGFVPRRGGTHAPAGDNGTPAPSPERGEPGREELEAADSPPDTGMVLDTLLARLEQAHQGAVIINFWGETRVRCYGGVIGTLGGGCLQVGGPTLGVPPQSVPPQGGTANLKGDYDGA